MRGYVERRWQRITRTDPSRRRFLRVTSETAATTAIIIACGSSSEKTSAKPERIEYYKNYLPRLADYLDQYLLLPSDKDYRKELISRLRDNNDVEILENIKIIPLPAREDDGSPQEVRYQVFPPDYSRKDKNILPIIEVFHSMGKGETDRLTITIFVSEDGKLRPMSKLHPMSAVQVNPIPDYVPCLLTR